VLEAASEGPERERDGRHGGWGLGDVQPGELEGGAHASDHMHRWPTRGQGKGKEGDGGVQGMGTEKVVRMVVGGSVR